MLKRSMCALVCCFAFSSAASVAQAPDAMAYKAAATTKFGNHPALPACVTLAVQEGDPGKGPAVLMLKFKAGCNIPWHWHTAQERLIIVSGSGKGEVKDMKPLMLKPGDFLPLPGKGIHQFTAITPVMLYDLTDAPFDIHYVNPAGKEIAVADALKPASKPAPSK